MSPAPEISLVICTYNRAPYLQRTLQTVAAQQVKENIFELLIIDNNSTDDTRQVAEHFFAAHQGLHARYFFESNKGLSFARNRGLKEAAAPVVAYIDDDVFLPDDYVAALTAFYRSYPQASGAGGKVIPYYDDGKEPAWMNTYLNGFIGKVDFGSGAKLFDKKMKYPAGCNMSYKADVLHAAGGFNNALTFRSDDKYIFYKVWEKAPRVYYVPQAHLQHHIDSSRLQLSNFKKLFLKTGNEEKKRVLSEQGTWGWLKKLAEFKFKFFASLVLYVKFTVQGHSEKGRFVVISQWNTLMGFLKREVFVR